MQYVNEMNEKRFHYSCNIEFGLLVGGIKIKKGKTYMLGGIRTGKSKYDASGSARGCVVCVGAGVSVYSVGFQTLGSVTSLNTGFQV